ncbi:MAG: hypothetical protein AAGD22_00470 [Verrucomicrobiota bacterium]
MERSNETYENVFKLLRARHVRNNDKRLRNTWVDWDENGDPIYEASPRVSQLLIEASRQNTLGGANLQGPVEHPDLNAYLLGPRIANQWNWQKYSRDSSLYHQHLRTDIDRTGRLGFPFVFGIGHESNNDASIETMGLEEGCLDGIAFMGDLPTFRDLIITGKKKAEGDMIQARLFFRWYQKTLDEMIAHYGSRDAFLVAAAQPHTNANAITVYFKTLFDLINLHSQDYIPDYIGSHARWNIPGQNRFFKTIVEPSRELFAKAEPWQVVPLMCNEFGAHDYRKEYNGTLRGTVSLLNNLERLLKSPDVAYVNFIYNRYFEEQSGRQLHPAFHAFRFYQDMPQSRTQLTGSKPKDLHVLSSRAHGSRQDAMLWRDESGEGTHTINFTFANASDTWKKAKVSLYLLSAHDPGDAMSSPRRSQDYGFARYLVKGYPKIIHGREYCEHYTFADIEMPPCSVALLRMERLDQNGVPVPDKHLHRTEPADASYLKTWQWTARNQSGKVDPSWGFFDHRNWTLFAGIHSLAGSAGSAPAPYRQEPDPPFVKRGLTGVEFRNERPRIHFTIERESNLKSKGVRMRNAFSGIRIDFYNGRTGEYDAAITWADQYSPSADAYQQDHFPWGYGGSDPEVVPQELRTGLKMDGSVATIHLDREYQRLTGNTDGSDFIAGGRRIIVSAWVENVKDALVIRLGKDERRKDKIVKRLPD